MKYLLSLYHDETRVAERSPEELREGMRQWDAYTTEVKDAGAFLGGEGLEPTALATTVQIQPSGDQIVTDGPFAETKEQLGGFYLLECENLDEAIAWARKIPMPGGKVEVRPVMDYEARGSAEHTPAAEAARSAFRRWLSTACSERSRDGRSRRSSACSATSTLPRRRCRTPSSSPSRSGRLVACPATRLRG